MQFVTLLSVLLCVLSFAAAQSCPSTGIACYPSDCCSQYRLCVGDEFFPVQNTASGTVCKAGNIVHARECTTPCSSIPVPVTQAPTQAATKAPTQAATQAPTQPATLKPTERPTQAPTQAATKAPTQAATQAPTQPATPKPTEKPTQAPPVQPTSRPVSTPKPTEKPTLAPTQAPTQKPTQAATQAPTQAPTEKPTQAPTKAPSNGICNLADVFTQADYNALFPHANGGAINGLDNQHAIFNYSYLIDAAKRFPNFACEGDVATRKREVAAFLAHTSQETSGWWAGQPYNWGYYFSTELGCTDQSCAQYCESYSSEYPCAAGKGYYGRGPIQLSWNYNYGQVSKFLYGNDVLLKNPDMMFDTRGTAFTTALWFWMTSQNPKPSCHDVMVGNWVPSQLDINAGRKPGFGMTTNVVNGGLECGYTTPQKVLNRIGYYTTYTNYLGVSAGDNLECAKMHSY